jgi:hypothetical protein
MVYDNLTIDCGNPVDWTHPTMQPGMRPAVWLLALPGLMGGAKWHDLMSPPDLRVGNHGTLTNGPVWRGASRRGAWGEVNFDGVDDKVVTPTVLQGGSFTICAWTYDLDNSINRDIVYSENNSNWNLRTDFGASYRFGVSASGFPSIGFGSVVNRKWTFLSAGYNAATSTIFASANAAPFSILGSVSFSMVNAPINVGLGAGTGFVGAIDDVCYFRRALSIEEVVARYDFGPRSYPGVLRRMRRVVYGFPSSFVVVPPPVTDGEAELSYLTEGEAELSSLLDGEAELTLVTEGVAELE